MGVSFRKNRGQKSVQRDPGFAYVDPELHSACQKPLPNFAFDVSAHFDDGFGHRRGFVWKAGASDIGKCCTGMQQYRLPMLSRAEKMVFSSAAMNPITIQKARRHLRAADPAADADGLLAFLKDRISRGTAMP